MGKREFTLTDLMSIALKRIWFILAAMVVCAAISFYYGNFMVTPQYQSTAKYLVDTTSMVAEETGTNGQVEEQRNTVLSRLVVPTYIEILKTRNFANHIAAELNTDSFEKYALARLNSSDFDELLSDERRSVALTKEYTGEMLYRTISYSFQEELESYTVSVTAFDAADALLIAECIAKESGEYLLSKRNSAKDTLKVIDSPRFTPAPVNVNIVLSILLGAFIGAVISFVIAFMIEINDVRVRDEKELSDILELPVIGNIPEYISNTDTARSEKK